MTEKHAAMPWATYATDLANKGFNAGAIAQCCDNRFPHSFEAVGTKVYRTFGINTWSRRELVIDCASPKEASNAQ